MKDITLNKGSSGWRENVIESEQQNCYPQINCTNELISYNAFHILIIDDREITSDQFFKLLFHRLYNELFYNLIIDY